MVFFFNDTATTEIYTLSLHDALPILANDGLGAFTMNVTAEELIGSDQNDRLTGGPGDDIVDGGDRKSTRLNSSHANISYAVFCLKKKKPHLHSTLITRSYPHDCHYAH